MRSLRSWGLIKRALPFIATFAVALFITSFFVDLNRPRFGRWRGGRQEMYRLRSENEQLRAENERLRAEMGMRHPGDQECEIKTNLPKPPIVPAVPHDHR